MKDRIIELLERGERVELECVDRDGFLSDSKTNDYIIGLKKIVVCEYDADEEWFIIDVSELELFESNYCGDFLYIEADELKYFKIKEPKYTFNYLIDVAIQAYKDGVVDKVLIEDTITIVSKPPKSAIFCLYKTDINFREIESIVRDIESLYTETFTIEEHGFPELKVGGIFTQNGNDVVLDADRIDTIMNTPLFLIKGAKVTQKRGKQ